MKRARRLALMLLFWGFAAPVWSHPVPRDQYDQIIAIHLLPGKASGEITVRIDFRLEVDPQTVVLKDMPPFRDEIDLNRIKTRSDYFGEFTRIYADIYARNFFTRVNKGDLKWTCVSRRHTFEDEKGEPLDHLRCDFRFEGAFVLLPGKENQFLLKDLNYQDHPGRIEITFDNRTGLSLKKTQVPEARLFDLPFEKRGPEEEEALRTVRLRFDGPETMAVREDNKETTSRDEAVTTTERETDEPVLKTENSGGVSQEVRVQIQAGLGLAMGLIITGMGLWLLLQRLAGRADHFHVGGHHHHGHGHGHTHHHGPPDSPEASGGVKWWGLVALGITGGLIPCWDAIALLMFAININEFWLALPLLLSFSAGLAGVLVLIGILVVKFRGQLSKRWGDGRLVRSLPLVSAVVITLMGIWCCHEALSGMETSEDDSRSSLLRLFLSSGYGLMLMLFLAAVFGAVHALTPGHGKTMVAAYLVGERGTVWHAVTLGFVTTLTHTGVVLLIAAGLRLL